MPPVLDPSKSKVDGLAFLGLSLTRKSKHGHPDSATHQAAFDLNDVLDREYRHLFSSNDDGWLVGGGEPGPPDSYKLAAKDSAHVEIMRIGTYRKDWGGLPVEAVVDALRSGKILVPQIEVVPTGVVANPDTPPELEIRFDMEPAIPNFADAAAPLPVNWQLRFLHNQLFKHFEFPSRFCPGAFHSTILRKAEFRSPKARNEYFAKCEKAVKAWKKDGVKPLVAPAPLSESIAQVKGSTKESSSPEHQSGLWLFTDRETITHHFEPNFLPPYDTPEKQKIILDFLKEEWDEKTLSWKPVVGTAQPKAEPKGEPKAEPKAEPKGETKGESKAEPKAEPKGEPKAAEPKPESKEPPGEKRISHGEQEGEEKKEDDDTNTTNAIKDAPTDPDEVTTSTSIADELSLVLQKNNCTDCGVRDLLENLLINKEASSTSK